MLKVFLSRSSRKFLEKCEKSIYDRILKKIKDLSIDPFPLDSKRIKGRKEKVFRVRVSDYRLLYVVLYDKDELLISNIDKRPKIYKK